MPIDFFFKRSTNKPVQPEAREIAMVTFCDDQRSRFDGHEGQVLNALAQKLYSNNNPCLADTFTELAMLWHQKAPNDARMAVESALRFASSDIASLTAKAFEQSGFIPSDGRYPESVLMDVARQSLLYKTAENTLKRMDPKRHDLCHSYNTFLPAAKR